jgi:Putative peptidoglycan binding domain
MSPVRHARKLASPSAWIGPVAALAIVAALAPATAAARAVRPTLVWVHCIRTAMPCYSGSPVIVVRTGELEVGAHGLLARTRVLIPARDSGRYWTRSVSGRLVRSTRMLITVPSDAVSGVLQLVSPGSARSNGIRITVRRPPAPVVTPPAPPVLAGASVLDGTGMWIWYLSASQGGDPVAIGRQAAAHAIRTVFLKSGDGANNWAQFSPANVAALKAQGLHVCAWQYVYGNSPLAEAQVGIQSAHNGAECLVIDAESEYEGRYAQAQQYIQALRKALGPAYPIGLASFPYVDYHPAFPYSVFLGPGGAQYNLPQMYWQDIGTSVDAVYAHTWPLNRVYGAPIYPLGQIYNSPPFSAVLRFRQDAAAYGAAGVSWWDWQEATTAGWGAVGAPIQPLPPPSPAPGYPRLSNGSSGDLVVWAQEHLVAAGATIATDGSFGPKTATAVRAFQTSKGIPATGVIDATTWPALLALKPAAADWAGAARVAGAAGASGGSGAVAGSGRNGPKSAFLPAVRDEIGRVGAG